MALTEKLQLIIDADGKGAVRGLEKVGASADRNLGKTDDRLGRVGAQLTSFGTATVAAAAVAGAGLYKVAQSASAYGEQVSRATKVFGDDAVPQLEDFADSAAETAGISKTAALEAANNFAAFGKQAGLTGTELSSFSEVLVQSAGDFASLNDIPVDQAILAFGSALSGEAEPLKRFGIDVSDTAVKMYALENGIGDASGALTQQEKVLARNGILMQEGALWANDFADTSDSLGNRQKKLAADFENAKVALGNGLLPIAEAGIGIVGGLSEKFSELSPEAQSAIGQFAGFGVVAAGSVGALSLIAGQVIKVKQNLGPMVGKLRSADGGLNNMGKAAKFAGGALATLAVADIAFDVINGITNASGNLEDALNRVVVASNNGKGSVEGVADAFIELADADDEVLRLGNLISDWGTDIVLAADGTSHSLERVQRVFDDLAESDPGAARQWLDHLEDVNSTLEEGSGQYQANTEFLNRNRESLELAGAAGEVAKDGIDDVTGAMEDQAGSTDEATSALQEYADAIKAQHDPLFAAVDAMEGMEDAQRGVYDAQAEVNKLQDEGKTGTIEYADAVESLDDAQRDAARAAFEQEGAMADLAVAVRDNAVNVDDARNQMVQWGRQAGLTQADAQRVADEYLGAAGAADVLGSKHPEPTADLDSRPFYEKYIPANASLFAFGAKTATSTVNANAQPFWGVVDQINRYRIPDKTVNVRTTGANVHSLLGAAGGRHGGGLVSPQATYVVGEQGPELFTPASAGSIIPNHDLGNHVGGSGVNGDTYAITINTMSSAGMERAVLDAIAAAKRKGSKVVV